jgi:predicted transcriptional regulator
MPLQRTAMKFFCDFRFKAQKKRVCTLSVKPAESTISTLLCLLFAKNFLAAEESKSSGKRKRGRYSAYTDEQIAKFINFINSVMSQRKAAKQMAHKTKNGQ